MTTVAVTVLGAASIFLPLQLTGDWQHVNMATVTNRRKVLSVEGKVNVIRTIKNNKKKP